MTYDDCDCWEDYEEYCRVNGIGIMDAIEAFTEDDSSSKPLKDVTQFVVKGKRPYILVCDDIVDIGGYDYKETIDKLFNDANKFINRGETNE